MPANINEYHFVTNWQVKATAEEVFDILNERTELPRWWPSVYLDLRIIEKGDSDGIGTVTELYTKGFLPYTLKWKFRSTEKRRPNHLALEAFGDLEGKGFWTIREDGDVCRVTYDWRIKAEKPILKYLSFLLKPLFSANHHWAMRRGEESLKLELLRKRATSASEKEQIPAPPGPVFPHNLTNNKIFR